MILGENTARTDVRWLLPKVGEFGLSRLPAFKETVEQAGEYRFGCA